MIGLTKGGVLLWEKLKQNKILQQKAKHQAQTKKQARGGGDSFGERFFEAVQRLREKKKQEEEQRLRGTALQAAVAFSGSGIAVDSSAGLGCRMSDNLRLGFGPPLGFAPSAKSGMKRDLGGPIHSAKSPRRTWDQVPHMFLLHRRSDRTK